MSRTLSWLFVIKMQKLKVDSEKIVLLSWLVWVIRLWTAKVNAEINKSCGANSKWKPTPYVVNFSLTCEFEAVHIIGSGIGYYWRRRQCLWRVCCLNMFLCTEWRVLVFCIEIWGVWFQCVCVCVCKLNESVMCGSGWLRLTVVGEKLMNVFKWRQWGGWGREDRYPSTVEIGAGDRLLKYHP